MHKEQYFALVLLQGTGMASPAIRSGSGDDTRATYDMHNKLELCVRVSKENG